MPKKYINPPQVFSSIPLGFSQAVSSPSGRLLFLSGQTAWDASRKIVGGKNLRTQTEQSLRNIGLIVQASGGTIHDVVSLRIYVVRYNPSMAGIVSDTLKKFFPSDRRPATTWIGVDTLAVPGFLVEIEAIAVLEQSNKAS